MHPMPMSDVQCFELSRSRLDDYLAFFDGRAFTDNPRWSGCYCYFPLHDPEKTDWHKRSAAENRQAVCNAAISQAVSSRATAASTVRR